MDTKFLYSTVASAVNLLRNAGFNNDFSLEENGIVCNDKKIDIDDLKIVTVSRYEGNSDPGDEASVYGLESNTGLKGILITGEGIYSNNSMQVFKKLHSKMNLETKA
jgi:hypothetical protein